VDRAAAWRLARGALRGAIGLVYPPACIACGAATGDAHALCPAC
jgi:hypothetical protein